MSWLTPGLGGLIAAIAVPTLVILYFLKLRRRDVAVSSTLLWKKAIEDMRADAPFQKLRKNILLLLQLLALAALCLALAQPVLDAGGGSTRRHVIMLDRSASMNARDGGNGLTRFERARQQARDLVESFRDPGPFGATSADEAMLIVFDSTAEMRQPFTSNKSQLLAALDRVTPTDAPGDVDEAFRLAQAHAPRRIYIDERTNQSYELEGLAGGEAATIHLFSDGRLPGAEEALPRAGDEIIYYQIGEAETPNVGITALRAERGFERPGEMTVFVGLQSTFGEAREVDVELAVADGPSLVRRVTVPGKGSAQGERDISGRPTPGGAGVVFRLDRAQASEITATVTPPEGDGLAVDNTGWLSVPAARSARVALVTDGSVFLTAALEGLPLEELVVFTPAQYRERIDRGDPGPFDVVVFDGLDGFGRELPAGRHLVLGGVPAPVEFEPAGEDDGASVIIDWTASHPALRDARLGGLVIAEMPTVDQDATPAEGWALEVLAESDRGPAIFELSGPSVRAIVSGFDPAASNWPFDVSFVVFLAAAIGDLGGPAAEIESSLRPGGVLRGRLSEGSENAQVITPTGERAEIVPAADGSFAYGPVRTAGLYRVATGGGLLGAPVERRSFAVNLLDPEESDIGSESAVGLATEEVAGRDAGSAPGSIAGWRWLTLGCLLIVLVEWWMYNRRVRI